MRNLLAVLALIAAQPAFAQSEISAQISAEGLEAVRTRLAEMAEPSDAERFALGGVTFLRAIEVSLQERWRVGLNTRYTEIPVLRLPVPDNPAPDPFEPAFVRDLFADVAEDMAAARDALAEVPEESDFGLEIALSDLWFDIDMDGVRGEREGLMEVAGLALMGARALGRVELQDVVVRFDVADVPWLVAYTHFISGVSEAVLAYDPTDAVADVIAVKDGLAALDTELPPSNAMDMEFGFFVDRLAMVWHALRSEPDQDHAAAAHAHFLEMIDENRRFWRLVAAETDDDREWLPNDMQKAALGFEVPEGTGAVWQGVLDDAEGLLNGEKLIPYWRLDRGAGLNLKRMFLEPRPVDLVDWIQGAGALPYAEKGVRVTGDNWFRFEQMFRGDALLFVVFLN
ncbi:hypothetical protein [Ostreiculturibacter nitratireducens]|uniref:hypothetical protein n=1 Tax=Ostreiculturibacter nitratireducens TaxID=3075226 RepID=UPI0031B5A80F